MKELSVFVDESGKFGDFYARSKCYIISFVFRDQTNDLSVDIEKLNAQLQNLGFRNNFKFHAEPIIRNKEKFSEMTGMMRRKIFAMMFAFFRKAKISYKTFVVNPKYVSDINMVINDFKLEINNFIEENYRLLSEYRTIKIYYDNGRAEVKKLLSQTFVDKLENVDFKTSVRPERYKLQQVTDMVCMLELVKFKMRNDILSKSEKNFFRNNANLRANYLRPLARKKFKGKF